MPGSSSAGDLAITHEVFVEPGNVPDPEVMVGMHDNEFVVAGRHGHQQAWATRVDAQGNVKWRHTLPVVSNTFASGPAYYSAAAMTDDSVFLCGVQSNPTGPGYHGLLTHIDKAGKVVSEQALSPDDLQGIGPKNVKLSQFFTCMPWNDGLIAIGNALRPLKKPIPAKISSLAPKTLEPLYWVVAFDANGKIEWERLVPIVDGEGGGFGDGMALFHQSLADGGFLLAGGYNNEMGTEIIHFGPQGDVVAKKFFPKEDLTPVQPVDDSDTTLQLASAGTEKFTLITLDKDLQEVKRLSAHHERGHVEVAYRLPGQSLVLFGERRLHEAAEARVTNLSPTLQDEQNLYFQPRHGAFSIRAAVPMDGAGNFATARLATDPSIYKETAKEFEEEQKKGISRSLGLGLTTVRTNSENKNK